MDSVRLPHMVGSANRLIRIERRRACRATHRDALNAAGLDRLSAAQRVVFEDLSPEELRVVGAVQDRLNAAAPEVEGQSNNNTVC